jgi:hypothetical protein
LTGVSYSDATPAAALGYDAFQRPAFASNAVARYAYQNSHLGTATNETAMVGGDTATLARTLDHRHRLAELRVEDAPPVQYGYDSENRHSAVSNDAFSASYAYTDDAWDAGYTITQTNGIVLSRTVIRDPYRRHLVTIITNSVNGVPLQAAGLHLRPSRPRHVTKRRHLRLQCPLRGHIRHHPARPHQPLRLRQHRQRAVDLA